MNIPMEEKKQEALKRLEKLTEVFGLNPNIRKYFEEGRLYYSYLTGIVGCIDTIEYDERYANCVKEFEESRNYLVYHVIETGDTIALLYVSDLEEEWEVEELYSKQYISAYVYDFSNPEHSEFGDIAVTESGGALVRIG